MDILESIRRQAAFESDIQRSVEAVREAYAEVGERWKHTHYTKDLPDDRLHALLANLAAGRPPWAATTEEVTGRLRALLAPHAALTAELSGVAHPEHQGDPVEALITSELVEETRAALQAQRHAAWVAAVEGEVAKIQKETLAPIKLPEVGRKIMYAGSSMPARIQYALEFLTAIDYVSDIMVGMQDRENRTATIQGYVTGATATQLAIPPRPVRDLTSSMRELRELIDEEASALEEARTVALATRTPKRLKLIGIAVGLFVFMVSVFALVPAPPKGESNLLHLLAGFAFFGAPIFGILALAADGSGTVKDQLVAQNFPLINRRVAEAVTVVQAAPTAEDGARLEKWKSDTIDLLRTLTTDEGWAAVAKDARLMEGVASAS